LVYRKNIENYLQTIIDGDLVLMNVDSGAFNALKDTGLAIWEAIDGERDLADIVALLADQYDVAPAVCASEVHAFVDTLVQAGFVVAA
jgi:hypothetical protein